MPVPLPEKKTGRVYTGFSIKLGSKKSGSRMERGENRFLPVAFCQPFKDRQGFFHPLGGNAVGDAEVARTAKVVAGNQHQIHLHGSSAKGHGIGFQ